MFLELGILIGVFGKPRVLVSMDSLTDRMKLIHHNASLMHCMNRWTSVPHTYKKGSV